MDDDEGWTNVSVKKPEQRGAGRKSIHTAPHLGVSQKQQSRPPETQGTDDSMTVEGDAEDPQGG